MNTAPAGTDTSSDSDPTGENKPREYSAQDQKRAETITGGLEIISAALGDSEIVGLLSERGYDDAALREGLALQAAAQGAFTARQNAPGTKADAKKLRDAVYEAAQDFFSGYRQTVQKIGSFTAEDRKTLGADGKVTKDFQKFVTNATAAFQAAQKPPYTELLTKRSYSVARLNIAIAELATLAEYNAKFTGAKALAKGATSARNEAFDALNTWLSEFKTNARLALKNKPVLLGKLGV
ncbi:MAG: hypothetical protein QM790_03235 [Nibricoccus sp.]